MCSVRTCVVEHDGQLAVMVFGMLHQGCHLLVFGDITREDRDLRGAVELTGEFLCLSRSLSEGLLVDIGTNDACCTVANHCTNSSGANACRCACHNCHLVFQAVCQSVSRQRTTGWGKCHEMREPNWWKMYIN